MSALIRVQHVIHYILGASKACPASNLCITLYRLFVLIAKSQKDL